MDTRIPVDEVETMNQKSVTLGLGQSSEHLLIPKWMPYYPKMDTTLPDYITELIEGFP
jgi:hypothetical protein